MPKGIPNKVQAERDSFKEVLATAERLGRIKEANDTIAAFQKMTGPAFFLWITNRGTSL